MAKKICKSIINYVYEEMSTFNEKPFNDVDSLILCQFSYVHLNGLVSSVDECAEGVSIFQLLRSEYFDEMFDNVLYAEKTKRLLFEMAASPRFREVKLNYYEEKIDLDEEKQFSSVTFFLPNNQIYVAFRGTDETIIGWKEDFNMTFMEEIPAQRDGLVQLEKIAALTDLPIMVGGHSKGGNIAVYAAAKCRDDIFDRIATVYSHDGPGFRNDVIHSGGFERVSLKTRKTVPEFAVIGMLLQQKSQYRIVESKERLLWQHDPFSWNIDNGDFIYKDNIDVGAMALNDSISQWLEQISDDDRKKFIDNLYQIVVAGGASNIQDFEEQRFKNAMTIIDVLRSLDAKTRKFLFQIAHQIAAISVKNLTSAGLQRNYNQLQQITKRHKDKK